MYTDVDIANLACVQAKVPTITAIGTSSKHERAISYAYALIRDEILAEIDPKFAQKEAQLNAVTGETHTEWKYAYTYPSDCLKARHFIHNNIPHEFDAIDHDIKLNEAETGKLLLANITEVKLKYTKRVTNPSLFDTDFIKAMIDKLAAYLTRVVWGDIQSSTFYEQSYSSDKGTSIQKNEREPNIRPVDRNPIKALRNR